MSSLKKKFVSGVVWESFGRFSSLGIQFFVTIIIARILTPAEFGIIGLLTVFIALGQIFLDSGFSQALIQKKEATQVDFSSIYFLNMFTGLFIYAVLFFLSPFVAEFYDLPELTNYARVLFLIIPINSFGLIQNVIIQKELTFKKTALASLISAIISGIVGITMAYYGYGVWALVGQQISIHTTKTLLYIIQRRWMPIFKISFVSIKEMFSFSMNLLAHSFVNVVMKNIYVLIIGKFFPVSQVGYYNQATKFEDISAGTITQIILKVSFPALVHKKDEPVYLRIAYLKIINVVLYVIIPVMFFLLFIAKPLFQFLLTDKWLPAVPYFQILCVYGMCLPILQISYNLYKLFRKGRALLIIDTIRHLLVLVSIFFTIKYGIDYMLYGLVFCTIIMSVANLYFSGRLISLSLYSQIKSFLPNVLLALFMGVIIYLLPNLYTNFITVFYKFIIFTLGYITLSFLFKFSALQELLIILSSFKKKKI